MTKPTDFSQVIDAAAKHPAVLAALRAKAQRMLPRAQRLAHQAGANGFAEELHVETGTRPGTKAEGGFKRPYARITADITEDIEERDAGASLTRTMIMRRSARA